MGSLLLSRPSPADPTADALEATAVWFGGPKQVELRKEAIGPVGARDVLVRARASAISHGTEMLVYRGQVDRQLALDLPTLRGSFGFPIKYGYASVGSVMQCGSAVEDVNAGDLVFVHHPHQSTYIVPPESAQRLPPGVDPETATLLANVETAITILLDSGARIVDKVLVFGQGVVGLLVTQVLRRQGVKTILAVDPMPKLRELALSVGAVTALEPSADFREQVEAATEGSGADLAIEVSGNPAALNLAIDSLRFQGTLVAASWYGTKPVSLQLGGAFHRNRLRIVSSQVSHMDPALAPQWTAARRREVALGLLQELSLAPLISHRFPISDATSAYRLIDEHPDQVVQVLFTYV
jgi:2-desacetyl-2-hydroxyethyl bacteriochlorophyllide A dehydrogenase